MNITIIPASDRFTARHSWLTSHHLFSFADYYDPENVHFGALRVFNDDIIDAHQGFGMHPHKNMEIITIVLSGAISHEDSHGGKATVGPGGVQVMSAGSGLFHSEMNRGEDPVHLYQIWIQPREQDIAPRHDERDFSGVSNNTFSILASGFGHDALVIHADAIISRGVFHEETSVNHDTYHETPNIFLYVTHGTVTFSTGEKIETGDQARITDVDRLEMSFSAGTDVVMIEVGD